MNEWGALIVALPSVAAVIIAAIIRWNPPKRGNHTYSTYSHHGVAPGTGKTCEIHTEAITKHGEAIVEITTKMPIIQADLASVKVSLSELSKTMQRLAEAK
jgi:hypothetical protein